jgi:predicted anti-sigma-YlaC factor YlaD
MSTESSKQSFDCSQLKDVLPDYLDRSLRNEICAEIKSHMEECEDCRIYVETIETTLVLYKHCPENDVPEEIRIDLRRNLRAVVEKKGESEGS